MKFFVKQRAGRNGVVAVGQKRNKDEKTSSSKQSSRPMGRKRPVDHDEEIESSDESDSAEQDSSRPAFNRVDKSIEQNDAVETGEEKKLRLAKEYLEKIRVNEARKQGKESLTDAELALKLRQDQLEATGRASRSMASMLDSTELTYCSAHAQRSAVTCCAFNNRSVELADRLLFTGSKCGAVVKWSAATGLRLSRRLVGGTQIYCICVSHDDRYLVTGGSDCLVRVWSAVTMDELNTLSGHKSAVSGCAFRLNADSLQLFSCSLDRCVKVWALEHMAFVETLYGHLDGCQDIDSFVRDRCLTAGGGDRTIRLWKIPEESHLIFNCPSSGPSRPDDGTGMNDDLVTRVDCVAMLNEQCFVSGTDANRLYLWLTWRKKPVFCVQRAHSGDGDIWITAVAGVKGADLVASGSNTGQIKLWACGEKFQYLEQLRTFDVRGAVNSLCFSRESHLAIGLGRELRFGRWARKVSGARNCVALLKLSFLSSPSS